MLMNHHDLLGDSMFHPFERSTSSATSQRHCWGRPRVEQGSWCWMGCIHKMARYVVFICFNGEHDDKFPVGNLKEVDLALFNDFPCAGKLWTTWRMMMTRRSEPQGTAELPLWECWGRLIRRTDVWFLDFSFSHCHLMSWISLSIAVVGGCDWQISTAPIREFTTKVAWTRKWKNPTHPIQVYAAGISMAAL